MKFCHVLAITGALTGIDGVASAQIRGNYGDGKMKLARGNDDPNVFAPPEKSDMGCNMVHVEQSGLVQAMEAAKFDISKPFSTNITSDIFENEFLYIGAATFTVTWAPAADKPTSACPHGNFDALVSSMHAEYAKTCTDLQLDDFTFPRALSKAFPDCGTLSVTHADDLSHYKDANAAPGARVCGGSDKSFRTSTVTPLIRDFCSAFAEKKGAVGEGAQVLRTHRNVPHTKNDPLGTMGRDVMETSDLHIFAAFDKAACDAEARWPSEEQCNENLGKAMDVSAEAPMCKRECSVVRDEEGEWQLNYCDMFNEPGTGMTNGGYAWEDCFRWGIVDDLKEGLLGSIVNGKEEREMAD